MLTKNFYDVVTTRRSVRRYKPDPVPNELVNKLLDAARWAPTAGNLQPWVFYVIRDEQMKDAIIATTFVGYDKETGNPQRWIKTAPVLILVGASTKQSKARYGQFGSDMGMILDIGACIQNLLLAATTEGLGSCWVAGFDAEELAKVANLPKEIQPISIVTIGYPHKVPSPPPRLSVEDITTYLD